MDVETMAKLLHKGFSEEYALAQEDGEEANTIPPNGWRSISALKRRYYRASARRVLEALNKEPKAT